MLAAAGVQPPELAQVTVVIRDIIDAAPEGAWTSRSRYYVDSRYVVDIELTRENSPGEGGVAVNLFLVISGRDIHLRVELLARTEKTGCY